MKKIALILVGIMILSVMTVFADGRNTLNAQYNEDEKIVCIEGTLNYFDYLSNNNITIAVKSGNNTVHLGEFKTDNSGKYTYKFKLPLECDYENCTVSLRTGDDALKENVSTETVLNSRAEVEMKITNAEKGKFISTAGGKLMIETSVSNLLNLNGQYSLFIAEYDANNKLIKTITDDKPIKYDSNTQTVSYEYTPSSEAKTVRAFSWDSKSNLIPLGTGAIVSQKTYASDKLLKDENTINSDYEGDLVIAYIGGSLTAGESDFEGGTTTEGNKTWPILVSNYLQEQYPHANTKRINAGLGGTGSKTGKTRFERDVLSYNPDIIFVEFSVNDAGLSEIEHRRYLEAMLLQAKKCAKEPVIIYVHTPEVYPDEHSMQIGWNAGVAAKNLLLEHYGIRNDINIYDKFYSLYEVSGYTGTFQDYLSSYGYYSYAGEYLNVHPNSKGYQVFAQTIIEKFEENGLPAYLKKINDVDVSFLKTQYGEAYNDELNYSYNWIAHNDERISYSQGWEQYSKEHLYVLNEKYPKVKAMNAGDHYFKFPKFVDGISQALALDDAQFAFSTTANEFSLAYLASAVGQKADVYIDGAYKSTISVNSPYTNMMYDTASVKISDDNSEHHIVVKVKESTDAEHVFRFGYIKELYYNK